MTAAEASEVLELRQYLWPNSAPPADPVAEIRVWAMMLGAYPVEQVVLAMKSYRGNAFAPNLGEIEEAIDPTPTFETALAEFRRMHARGYSTLRWSEVPWSHPLIAAFAEQHFREWGLSPDGVADPSLVASEAAARAHLRGSFTSTRRQYTAGQLAPSREYGELRAGSMEIDGGRTDEPGKLSLVRSGSAVGGDGEGEEASSRPAPRD